MRWAKPRATVAPSDSGFLGTCTLLRTVYPWCHLSLTQSCQHPSVQMRQGRRQEAKGFTRGARLQNTRASVGTLVCWTHRLSPSQGKGDGRPCPSRDLVTWNCCVCTEGPSGYIRPHPYSTQLQVQRKAQILLVCNQMAGVWLLAPLSNGRMLRFI